MQFLLKICNRSLTKTFKINGDKMPPYNTTLPIFNVFIIVLEYNKLAVLTKLNGKTS